MAEPVLQITDLGVDFEIRTGFGRPRTLRAVDGVTLSIQPGETFAVVGESGSGKSTTARAVVGLQRVTRGSVVIAGTELAGLRRRALRRVHRTVQMVFQDPASSLDPRMTVGASIEEPLRVHLRMNKAERSSRSSELLELVGLAAHHHGRYPAELSGGQQQRIAIARALAVEPSLVVCDEAVSALDASTRGQVISLLEDLRERIGLAYMFISHDLSVVSHIASKVAVMYLGRVVESGPLNKVFVSPSHPYTRALLASVPLPDPRAARQRVSVPRGEIPDPLNPPAGCTFHPRCPDAMDVCRQRVPTVTTLSSGVEVRCHLYAGEPPAGATIGADDELVVAQAEEHVAR